MKKRGRANTYTEEMGERICSLVATHPYGQKKLCRLYPDLPDDTTIFDWRLKHVEFARQYDKAKRKQAELLAEEIIDIADDTYNDIIIDKNGNEQCNTEFVQRSRLRMDARKWLASKLVPKVYGDVSQIKALEEDNEKYRKELEELRAKLDAQNKKDY